MQSEKFDDPVDQIEEIIITSNNKTIELLKENLEDQSQEYEISLNEFRDIIKKNTSSISTVIEILNKTESSSNNSSTNNNSISDIKDALKNELTKSNESMFQLFESKISNIKISSNNNSRSNNNSGGVSFTKIIITSMITSIMSVTLLFGVIKILYTN